MTVVLMSSLTRIADLDRESYDVTKIDQDRWATGDYVAGKITGMPAGWCMPYQVTGSLVRLAIDQRLLKALVAGQRSGTAVCRR